MERCSRCQAEVPMRNAEIHKLRCMGKVQIRQSRSVPSLAPTAPKEGFSALTATTISGNKVREDSQSETVTTRAYAQRRSVAIVESAKQNAHSASRAESRAAKLRASARGSSGQDFLFAAPTRKVSKATTSARSSSAAALVRPSQEDERQRKEEEERRTRNASVGSTQQVLSSEKQLLQVLADMLAQEREEIRIETESKLRTAFSTPPGERRTLIEAQRQKWRALEEAIRDLSELVKDPRDAPELTAAENKKTRDAKAKGAVKTLRENEHGPTRQKVQVLNELLESYRYAKPLKEDATMVGDSATEIMACPICFEEFDEDCTDRIFLPCCHSFHGKCVEAWISSKMTCPTCRHPTCDQSFDFEHF